MNLIEQYLILTLPRSIKRQWAALMGAVTMGVPYDIVKFVEGIDARDYQENMPNIAEAAARDGYPFLRQFALGKQESWVQQSAGNVALFWGWARTLKYIAHSGVNTLLIWDDRIPRVRYDVIENVLAELYQRTPEFYIWQLRLRSHPIHLQALGRTEYQYEGGDAEIDTERTHFLKSIEAFVDDVEFEIRFPAGVRHPLKTPKFENYRFYLQDGLLGYDETMILSPRGAQWLLDEMLNMEDRTASLKDFEFPDVSDGIYTPENIYPQMRSRLNNDNFLHWGTTEAVRDALSQGKGLYCPKRIGYEFVYEPLNFNSDVHWNSNQHIGWYAPRETQIRFVYF